jgi:acetoin utilization protein AcuB
MTPFPQSIEAGLTIHDAQAIMQSEGIRHLPVTSEGRLVGIISDRDLKLAFALAGASSEGETLHVGDVCNLEAYIVEYNTPVDDVVMHMAEVRVSTALITRNGKLVGIFTSTDVCRNYSEMLKIAYPDA